MTVPTTERARLARGSETFGRSPEELREIVSHVGAELELAPAEDIIEWAVATFGDRFCITSSMADAVLSHLASKVAPGIDVVFLDTGYHFAETIGTRDAVVATMDVTVRTIEPRQTVAEQDRSFGVRLYERNPDQCCALRKVTPLRQALKGYRGWASGLRRDEAVTRRDVKLVEWDARRSMVKLNPIAAWNQDEVDEYQNANGILVNPLLYDGYGSIGCAPCTRRIKPGEDARAGRWAGLSKTECGIHD